MVFGQLLGVAAKPIDLQPPAVNGWRRQGLRLWPERNSPPIIDG